MTSDVTKRRIGRLHLHVLFAQPVLAPLLRHRALSIVLGTVGAIQAVAPVMHVVTFDCPFATVLRAPCPGCGLSRACAAILRGDFVAAIHWHAFAVPFLLAVIVFVMSIPLGAKSRATLADVIENFERKTCLSTMMLTGLLLYWLVRLVYLHGHYGALVTSSFQFH